jgi:hypothetical protein
VAGYPYRGWWCAQPRAGFWRHRRTRSVQLQLQVPACAAPPARVLDPGFLEQATGVPLPMHDRFTSLPPHFGVVWWVAAASELQTWTSNQNSVKVVCVCVCVCGFFLKLHKSKSIFLSHAGFAFEYEYKMAWKYLEGSFMHMQMCLYWLACCPFGHDIDTACSYYYYLAKFDWILI